MEIFFFQGQPGHIGADCRVKAKIMRHDAYDGGDAQRCKGRVFAFAEGKQMFGP